MNWECQYVHEVSSRSTSEEATRLWSESSHNPVKPMLEVGDGQTVLERLERVAVGDAARVTVRVQEAEPDRQLAKQIQGPVRKNPDPCSRGDAGHSLILDPVAVVDRTFARN